jgi:tetratricopeptide (TPR) repeat protein
MYRTHLHLGGALEGIGRWQEAQQHYQQAVALAPAAVEVHYNLGNSWRQLKHFDAALAAYQKSLELNPDYMPSLVNLGHMYFIEVKDSSQAIQFYQKAVQLETREPAVYQNLGSILHKRGEYGAALQIYTKGLTQIPSQVIFYLGLAMAHDRLGQRQRALDNYRTFLRFSRGKIALEEYSRARLQTLEQGEPRKNETSQ